ncbi:hypothetical protein BD410DRAFT_780240 [Rickenella mellea]|uniref:Uncharacterized protein n=1 Tax=Rickenella mellea TaxID=50990 RepID=A0A4R5XH55_9AGAM|nr:hypothetical protein BD410DRAFT_780240 [Rickenella mellea]
MNFTNINDPSGVAALLESLRSSQAWADLQNKPAPQAPASAATESSDIADSQPAAGPSTSVASLLSQLHPPQPASAPITSPGTSAIPERLSRPRREDLRGLSFQQSLPHVVTLSEDPTFTTAIAKMREDQNDLEKRLWSERQQLCQAQEEKVKVATTKAKMLGTGISQREAMTMTESFHKELQKFDKERVIPAWDGLVMQQQIELERMCVPTFFATNASSDLERQKRVIQLLEGITGPEQ